MIFFIAVTVLFYKWDMSESEITIISSLRDGIILVNFIIYYMYFYNQSHEN